MYEPPELEQIIIMQKLNYLIQKKSNIQVYVMSGYVLSTLIVHIKKNPNSLNSVMNSPCI